MVNIGNSWDDKLASEFKKEYYLRLRDFLKSEYQNYTIYPSMFDIFNALKYTPFEDVKVVLLGQDPYHGEGQAHGLCFSVKDGVPFPPSLQNIFKEMKNDLGLEMPKSGNLTKWAKQGVLLLNTTLTVRKNMANSHSGKGWEILTDKIIEILNASDKPKVFILWGNNAKSKMKFITNPMHTVLTAPHPSPLSAYSGFFGCNHFSKTNEILKEKHITPIVWKL